MLLSSWSHTHTNRCKEGHNIYLENMNLANVNSSKAIGIETQQHRLSLQLITAYNTHIYMVYTVLGLAEKKTHKVIIIFS